MKAGERGFAYVDLLVAVAIMALLGWAASSATIQVFKGTEHSSNHITAVRQVQSAGYWISRDAQMAQTVVTDNLSPPDFLILSWTEEGSGDSYQITYKLEDMPNGDMKKLIRSEVINGGSANTTFVAQHIDPDGQKTNCEFDPITGRLTLTITATVGRGSEAKSETRVYEISPRPG
jgi:type II secretory pathway component PulJ